MVTLETLQAVLDARFGGLLKRGRHIPDGSVCALELESVVRGCRWTDSPSEINTLDKRRLNDRFTSDQARTVAMLPMMVALWDWTAWSVEQQAEWTQRIARRTIREIVPIALRAAGLEDAAVRCEIEGTSAAAHAAYAAAHAAYTAAYAVYAVYAVCAAAYTAAYAAAHAVQVAHTVAYAVAAYDAAAYAADDTDDAVLILACNIWREEALSIISPLAR